MPAPPSHVRVVAPLALALLLGATTGDAEPRARPVGAATSGGAADTVPIPARARARFDSLTVDTLAPGAWHLSGVIAEGPWRVQAIVADLTQPGLALEAVRGGTGLLGRERTSVLARQWEAAARAAGREVEVLAAVNADFFDLRTGEQLASQVSGGRVLKALASAATSGDSAAPLAQLVVDARGVPHVVHGEYAGAIVLRDRTVALDAVNAVVGGGRGLALFDTSWARPLPLDSLGAPAATLALREAGTRGDTLLLVQRGRTARLTAAPEVGAPVLVAAGPSRARLTRLRESGDTLRLVHRFTPVGDGVRLLVGGRPVIVRRGRSLADTAGVFPGAPAAFAATRHPRTAVGLAANGTRVLLVTVDGRQERSVGMSLAELAELMLQLGATEALNLDGGGSTTAVVKGRVVNSPSDANGERPVANAVLLVR